jgi:hypothetical protein
MDKWVMVWLCIWLGFAMVGGLVDGKVLVSDDESRLDQLSQVEVLTRNPYEGTGWDPIAWATATKTYLGAVVNLGGLNFSFFDGAGQLIRWAILACAWVPTLMLVILRVIGR